MSEHAIVFAISVTLDNARGSLWFASTRRSAAAQRCPKSANNKFKGCGKRGVIETSGKPRSNDVVGKSILQGQQEE